MLSTFSAASCFSLNAFFNKSKCLQLLPTEQLWLVSSYSGIIKQLVRLGFAQIQNHCLHLTHSLLRFLFRNLSVEKELICTQLFLHRGLEIREVGFRLLTASLEVPLRHTSGENFLLSSCWVCSWSLLNL